jgi:ABC-type lipoprotein export system ATPase subunit
MFQQLNEEDGITIIVVTHDAQVARHTRRVIHIRDGTIVDGALDECLGPAPGQPDLIPQPTLTGVNP